MRSVQMLCLTIAVLCALPANILAQTDARTRDILNAVDDLWRGSSSHAIAAMHVQTAHYSRSMKIEAWSKGKDQSLFTVLAPLREKGTKTLKRGNHVYTYLPKTDRTIRLSAGIMMGAWMGSHFTHDDLVKESRLDDDFDAHISFEGERDGQQVLEFELIPKPTAAVVWGRIRLRILADSYVPLMEWFDDEDLNLARTFTFSGMKLLAGRLRPSVMRVTPAAYPDEYTEFVYESLDLNIHLEDSLFSTNALKRR